MLPFSQFSDGDSWWKIMTSNPDTTYWMTIDHNNGLVVMDGLLWLRSQSSNLGTIGMLCIRLASLTGIETNW